MRDTIPGEDREELIAQAGKQEIPLTLTNKFESITDDDESADLAISKSDSADPIIFGQPLTYTLLISTCFLAAPSTPLAEAEDLPDRIDTSP